MGVVFLTQCGVWCEGSGLRAQGSEGIGESLVAGDKKQVLRYAQDDKLFNGMKAF